MADKLKKKNGASHEMMHSISSGLESRNNTKGFGSLAST
jgi:hypothetical protein